MDSTPTTIDPTVFLLVRHAQTTWNKEQRHTGSMEVPLSPTAGAQIERLTRSLLKHPIAAVYSSPLTRCQLTVRPLVEQLGLKVHLDDRLIERDLGSWEGKSPADLLPTHPGYEFPKSAYTGEFRITGAETIEELEGRIRNFLSSVHEHHPGKQVLVATHSGVIWTAVHRIVSNPPEDFLWPDNCSLSTIVSHGNHFMFDSFEAGR
ncbi:MAG: histidine phosphatase family protein [bacterium]